MNWSNLSMSQRSESYTWTVYKHTSPSNKVYIGITKREPKIRWGNGNSYKRQPHFYNAIIKYGWKNFKHEVLYENLTEEQAKLLEISLIHYHKSNNNKFGYNLTNGGDGCKGRVTSEETKQKISKANKGKPGNHNKASAETIAKMRLAHLGDKWSPERRQKASIQRKGRKLKPETIQKIKEKNYKKVICIETGIEYTSIKEASEKTNICYNNIGACCNKRIKTAGGFHWRFSSDTTYEIPQNLVRKKVYCEELNKTFNSLREASLETKIPFNCISNAICGVTLTAGKLHWRRVYE